MENNDNENLINDILNAKKNVHKEINENENSITSEPSDKPEDNDSIAESNNNDDEKIEIKTHKKKKRKKKHSNGKLIFGLILATVIVTIAVVSATFIIKIGKDAFGIDKSEKSIEINIPKGSTTSDISEILYNANIIEEPLVFKLFSRLQKADSLYKEGTHTLTPNMSYETIISELQKETPKDTIDVTFPEGYTIVQCAKLLEDSEICNADDFINTLNTSSFGYNFESQVTNSTLKFYKMEGYLFPDTYRFYKDTDPEIVVEKIFANFAAKVDQNLLGRMKELNMTLDETITLASIVQAEAPESYEMKNVASVFINRLNNKDKFPLLQSDPTTKYVNEVIKEYIELDNETMCIAYDTYQGPGLPPGAICNPGIDAIKAVLYHTDTDYYYFCSNLDTREFFYSKTLSEHEKNLVKAGLK